MSKIRLDQKLVELKLARNRSNADSFIRMGKVKVNGVVATKSGHAISAEDKVALDVDSNYVSRAAYKLESATNAFRVDFFDKTVLDVGSSTGGFTEYSIRHGAKKVIAIDVGTMQMHPSVSSSPRVELHEKTDIRDYWPEVKPDIVLIDVSFISLREILPHISEISNKKTLVLAMLKPQFESGTTLKHKGVIKNDKIRREIIHDFELWTRKYFLIIDKKDSAVLGSMGNKERFYLLKIAKT